MPPMDRDRLIRTLSDLEQERADAEQQLAALQKRLESLRMTTEGMKGLLSEAEREPSSDESVLSASTTTLPTEARPPTGTGAQIILQTDSTRRWNPRQVWQGMVERGWAPDSDEGRTAVRVALTRLSKRDPDHVIRTDAYPTHEYQWVPNGISDLR
jgi:hypothetical protein